MNQLFIKQELDSAITKEQFLEDMDYLFENLRKAYGMYDYFGEDAFLSQSKCWAKNSGRL